MNAMFGYFELLLFRKILSFFFLSSITGSWLVLGLAVCSLESKRLLISPFLSFWLYWIMFEKEHCLRIFRTELWRAYLPLSSRLFLAEAASFGLFALTVKLLDYGA